MPQGWEEPIVRWDEPLMPPMEDRRPGKRKPTRVRFAWAGNEDDHKDIIHGYCNTDQEEMQWED